MERVLEQVFYVTSIILLVCVAVAAVKFTATFLLS